MEKPEANESPDSETKPDEESLDELLLKTWQRAHPIIAKINLQYWKDKLIGALEECLKQADEVLFISFDETTRNVSSFSTNDYKLEFCLDNRIEKDRCILIYDINATFDGEPREDQGILQKSCIKNGNL